MLRLRSVLDGGFCRRLGLDRFAFGCWLEGGDGLCTLLKYLRLAGGMLPVIRRNSFGSIQMLHKQSESRYLLAEAHRNIDMRIPHPAASAHVLGRYVCVRIGGKDHTVPQLADPHPIAIQPSADRHRVSLPHLRPVVSFVRRLVHLLLLPLMLSRVGIPGQCLQSATRIGHRFVWRGGN